MACIEIQEEIAAPANEVAAFFVPQRMPYWYGVEIQAQFEISDGCSDFRAGQKVRISGQVGRREVSLTAVITRFEFGHALEWRFQDSAGVRGVQSWELRPIAQRNSPDSPALENSASTRVIMRDGSLAPGADTRTTDGHRAASTRVVMRDEYEMPGRLGRLLDRVFTRHAVARCDRDALARLRRLSTRCR